MPDLTRKSLQEAENILKMLGVQYITESVPEGDDIPPGHVVATDPPAGAKIVPGNPTKIKVRQNPTPPANDPPTATPTPQMSGPVPPSMPESGGSGGSGAAAVLAAPTAPVEPVLEHRRHYTVAYAPVRIARA